MRHFSVKTVMLNKLIQEVLRQALSENPHLQSILKTSRTLHQPKH